MQLLVDTTQRNILILELLDGKKPMIRIEKTVDGLSENLLPEIQKFLRTRKVNLGSLSKILVNPGPGGFSSTRTGVATANALAYALGIPVAEWPSGRVRQIVLPKYDKEPNITKPRKFSPP